MAYKGGRHGRSEEEFWRVFWDNVNKDGPIPEHAPELGPCWMWTGSVDTKGYGTIGRHGKNHRAHRLSFSQLVGPIPDGLSVLHSCDVRLCVNTNHHFLGTVADNQADMAAKGRARNQGMAMTTCKRGHELHYNGKQRICRTCCSMRMRQYYANKVGHPVKEIRRAV